MSEPYVQVHGGSVLVAAPDGQVHPPDPDAFAVARAAGLHVRDCRVLSLWVLRVDGHEPVFAGGRVDTRSRRCALLPRTRRNESPRVWIVREQQLKSDGMTEQILVRNLCSEPRTVELTLDVESDFADQFTLRGDDRTYPASPTVLTQVDAGVLELRYRWSRDGAVFARTVTVTSEPEAVVSPRPVGHTLTWDLHLPARGEACITLRVRDTDAPVGPAPRTRPAPDLDLRAAAAALHAASARDLDGLVMPSPHAPDVLVPAAGPPWFMILAGRDALLTSLLAERSHPGLLPDVLTALARTQGTTVDPRLREQPGKIVHELRSGPLADLGVVPYSRYYGSVDATALFLMGIGQLAARGRRQDQGTVRSLEPAARAAVAWLCGDGGLDESGFVVYEPDPQGLMNQGWKDSYDAIAFPDGRLATGPIALVEVQAYAWAGLRATARCAREAWDAPGWAADLERMAAALRTRFHESFWLPRQDFLALALDGAANPVDTLASNAGHALWTGILEPDAAALVSARLASDDFHSGWSLRTVARSEPVYEPLSYHRGSCWPHDTALAMLGMARYGHRSEAQHLASGIVRSGAEFDGRLPELFAGFGQDDFETPVGYAYAARPQAWSAAAGVAAAPWFA